MAALNRFSFGGFPLNQPNMKITQMRGFGQPPLRGANWIAQNATGEQFVPKLHGGRVVHFLITIIDNQANARMYFDILARLFASRTGLQPLVNTLDDGSIRTAMAECIGWDFNDEDESGSVFQGVVDFSLPDPWFYGPTVTGSVVPNAGLAFGTAVVSNISGPRTTWTAALTGVTSGQPIIVVHATQGYTTALSSIADTFGGHYTWTRVDGANTYRDCEIYIGTGGTGTSGTVTVTAASGLIGGFAQPLLGASTAAGLGAIDAHVNGSGPSFGAGPTVTPTAPYEGGIWASVGASPAPSLIFPTPWPGQTGGLVQVAYSGSVVSYSQYNLYPPSGLPITSTQINGATAWDGAVAIIKGSGAAVTPSVTNPGSVLAEKLTLDFLGPIANPTITNTTTGTSVTINTTVAGTKHLIVDTSAMTALNDGANVIGSLSHSGATPFLTLAPGVNVLQVSGAACTGATLVTVSFASPYV
jgi:hypothetical protein